MSDKTVNCKTVLKEPVNKEPKKGCQSYKDNSDYYFSKVEKCFILYVIPQFQLKKTEIFF